MNGDSSEREKAGLAVLQQLGWGRNERVHELDADLWQIVTETNFGTLWSRPGLSLRDRELICIAILVASGAPGVALHFEHAHNVGLSAGQLKEIILQTIPYTGLPHALSAMKLLKQMPRDATAER